MKRLIVLLMCALATVACTVLATDKAGERLVLRDVAIWPDDVEETSGLALHAGLMWTINDSGDKPFIYALDSAGEVVKKVSVSGARNIDWEELTQDAQTLYIADSGNNFAKRKSLSIYRVPLALLDSTADRFSVAADKIDVRYADYASSVTSRRDHNVDSEALAKVGDRLWLFTKNRADHKTKLYIVDPGKSDQVVAPVATYPVNGLLTSADYNPETGMMALLGYKAATFFGQSFLWIVPVESGGLSWARARYWAFEPAGQWEAVMWKSDSELWLTTERNPLTINKLSLIELPSP